MLEDPCDRAARLRARIEAIISGEAAAELESANGNGVKRRTRFVSPDLDALRQELASAENDCRKKMGLPPRRRVTVGSYRA